MYLDITNNKNKFRLISEALIRNNNYCVRSKVMVTLKSKLVFFRFRPIPFWLVFRKRLDGDAAHPTHVYNVWMFTSTASIRVHCSKPQG